MGTILEVEGNSVHQETFAGQAGSYAFSSINDMTYQGDALSSSTWPHKLAIPHHAYLGHEILC